MGIDHRGADIPDWIQRSLEQLPLYALAWCARNHIALYFCSYWEPLGLTELDVRHDRLVREPWRVYGCRADTPTEKGASMRTNIVIEDRLIQAMRATGLSTKRAVVEAGLKLLVQVKAQTGIRRLRGKVAWKGNLDELRAGCSRNAS
jgi:Arc/MetJ family transcription regulator